ncbi:aminotransferase class I/II-fold pyridoxal phosphate-dependent enzyme [Paenibacillus sp. FSL H8-0122]|uniref:pyridoxal phosphate-dependent aminotransferase n=1 Tax=Paenibacillus sp. FSL H8-0122 TaxID=2954510 RepID=UPI0030F7CEED
MIVTKTIHEVTYLRFREYLDLTYSQNIKQKVVALSTGYPEPGEFPLPKVILSKLAVEINGVEKPRQGYGWDAGSQPLREILIELENSLHSTNYSIRNICMVAGATYGFNRILEAIFEGENKVKKLLVVGPTYYRMLNRVERLAQIDSVIGSEKKQFQITAEELIDSIDANTKAIFIANPTNPTYLYYSEDFFEKIIPFLEEKRIYLIIDESGDAFYQGEGDKRLKRFPAGINNKYVIRIVTASKKYLLAEYRIGYVLADETFMGDKTKGFIKIIGDDIGNAPLAVNEAWVEIALHELAVLRNEKCSCQQCDFITQMEENNRRMLYLRNLSMDHLLKSPSVENIIIPEANFNITFKINNYKYKSDIALFKALLKDSSISLLPCSGLGLDESLMYFRLTYGINEEVLNYGLDRLKKFLE